MNSALIRENKMSANPEKWTTKIYSKTGVMVTADKGLRNTRENHSWKTIQIRQNSTVRHKKE